MKASPWFVVAITLGLNILAGCDSSVQAQMIVGNGHPVERERDVRGFERVRLDGSIDAEITVGRSFSVIVHAEENIEPLIQTIRVGSTLEVAFRSNTWIRTHYPPRVQIEIPALAAVTTVGSGDVDIANVEAMRLELVGRGSGNIRVSGLVADLSVELSGSGDLQSGSLIAERVQLTARGSGNVDIHASGSIRGQVSGSGDLEVTGSPSLRDVRSQGSGEVHYR